MSSSILHLDWETRSEIDLREVGLDVYARHPSTDIWLGCWAFDDEEIQTWWPGQPVPPRIFDHITSGGIMCAHNAGFEAQIIEWIAARRYGWPDTNISQWRCTAAMAAALALPRSLEDVGAALGLPVQKDAAGRRLMLKMAKPRHYEDKDPSRPGETYAVWWDDETHKQRLAAYCKTDVEVERMVEKRLMKLSAQEQKVWEFDYLINRRGVRIDQELCQAGVALVEKVQQVLDTEISELTDGAITSASEVLALTTWLNDQGVKIDTLGKATLNKWIESLPHGAPRRALEIRQEYAKSSTAKLHAFLARSQPDGIMRDNLLYHGAGPGRWAGKGAQLQNLPRPKLKQPALAIPYILRGDPAAVDLMFGRPLDVVSDCIRSCIIAEEGQVFYCGDYANIEGRVNAVLAGQDDLVEAFRNDEKIYEMMAADIYKIPVESVEKDSPERTLGKAAVLGCGFQMGGPKFKITVEKEGIIISDELAAATVATYREKNHKIKKFWGDAEECALEAVRHPGELYVLRNISWRMVGSYLFCKLPSGRLLSYPGARVEMVRTPWGAEREQVVFWTVNSITRKWEETNIYGGKWVENIVQATARDLMVHSMGKLEGADYRVRLTVHDEILTQRPKGTGSLDEFVQLMQATPDWAKDWPIKVEAWKGERYRK